MREGMAVVRQDTTIARRAWLAPALGLLALLFAVSGWAREVSGVRMSSTPDNTRLVFDLDGPVTYSLSTLDDPRRVLIEMRDTRLGSNAGAERLRVAGSSVAAVRSAVQPDGTLRWVLELRGNQSARGFVLGPSGGHGHRLVVDVPAAAPAATLATAESRAPAPRPASARQGPAPVEASLPSTGRGGASAGTGERAGSGVANAAPAAPIAAPVAASMPPVAPSASPSPSSPPAPVAAAGASQAMASAPVSAPAAPASPASPAAAAASAPAAVPREAGPDVAATPARAPASRTQPPATAPAIASPAARAEPPRAEPARTDRARLGPLPPGGDIVFAIDAGHGGKDPGAIGAGGEREKDVVLAIAKQLAEFINAEPGFRAVLTRTGDYFIPLRERTRLARAAGAHFFISVHADAALNTAARGASVYALSERGATSEAAKWLAERENNADLVGGVTLDDKDRVLASVLLDLSMTASLTESLELGGEVLEELGALTRLHSRRVEQAGFMVLKSPDIPSVLVETGFISNAEDARNLASDGYRERVARAIFRGVREQALARPPQGTAVAARLRARSAPVAAASAGPETPPPTASAALASADACPCDYTVVRGDTLRSIAERFRVPAVAIRRLNEMRTSRVRAGQTLRIPAASSTGSASTVARES